MACPDHIVSAGAPESLGLICDSEGANIAVFSEHATAIELCLFSQDGTRETTRIALPERAGNIWHGRVEGIRPGDLYGLRAHGAFSPADGHRFNPSKLLLDPYATSLSGPVLWSPALVGHSGNAADPTDSAPYLPKCIAAAPLPWIDPSERPHTPWSETVIYEAHPKGLTQRWPGLDAALQGHIAALGSPEMVAHLKDLGITALELLPIHAFTDERHLVERGLSNYWGYNSVSFFAPETRYSGPGGVSTLRETVRRLHDAGIEIILDVVYNHTGEGDVDGPTLSYRGLDNLSYYHRDPDAPGGYANHTGCGNTFDLSHPFALRLVLDSMRWWVERIGIDGFRFDLAPALMRGPGGFDPGSAFLDALLQDPVLRNAKLIAEPWDIGPDGYRPGLFPAPIAEWNDRFRDSVRSFWRGDSSAPAALADGLLGSSQIFDCGGRQAWSSVNFVACHDGFTLADLTLYAERRNTANGENNRDGHAENLSDDFGHPGPSADHNLTSARERRRRNLLATALLAQGTPMLRAGDEIAQSQDGNNNAYCQDNAISWIDWASGDRDLLVFTCRLLALRRHLPALRQSHFLHGALRAQDGLPDTAWFGLDGKAVDWDNPSLDGYALLLRGDASVAVLLVLNRGEGAHCLSLPDTGGIVWYRVLDTSNPDSGATIPERAPVIAPASLTVLIDNAELAAELVR